MGEEESFEGRSPRALGSERGFRGLERLDTTERVAKPWVWDFWETGHCFPDASWRQGVRRRVL
jgi:hypothetical protein